MVNEDSGQSQHIELAVYNRFYYRISGSTNCQAIQTLLWLIHHNYYCNLDMSLRRLGVSSQCLLLGFSLEATNNCTIAHSRVDHSQQTTHSCIYISRSVITICLQASANTLPLVQSLLTAIQVDSSSSYRDLFSHHLSSMNQWNFLTPNIVSCTNTKCGHYESCWCYESNVRM